MSKKPLDLNLSPENIENNPAPKSLESELSPEIFENVMAKVQDINKLGTAFHFINLAYAEHSQRHSDKKIQSIFENGILGTQHIGILKRKKMLKNHMLSY